METNLPTPGRVYVNLLEGNFFKFANHLHFKIYESHPFSIQRAPWLGLWTAPGRCSLSALALAGAVVSWRCLGEVAVVIAWV